MQVDDLLVEVRDVNLTRIGQLLPDDLEDLAVVARVNDVGAWSLTLPDLVLDEAGNVVEHALCAALRTAGAGIIVTGPDGVILSGPMTDATYEAKSSSDAGVWTIKGVSDAILLADALAFPDPASADPGAQTRANDVRTGSAEDLLRRYVAYNIANGALTSPPSGWAPAGRLVGLRSRLRLYTPSLHRGATLTRSPRFDNLLELCQSIAATSGLVFDIVQVDDLLEFRVTEAADRSAFVRMDVENEQLDSVGYGYASPTATRPIVAGQGEGTERTIIERTSADAAEAESLWGRRIERFVDQRQTEVLAELEQAGDDLLAAEGTTVTSTQATPSEDLLLTYLVDWRLGDLVTVVVGGVEAKAKVVEVSLIVRDGVRVGATLGDPVGFDPEDVAYSRAAKVEERVSAIERNLEVGGATVLKGTIDPAWTTGLPRVNIDGQTGYTAGLPWVGSSMPSPGDRVGLGTAAGGALVILGPLNEFTSLGRYLDLSPYLHADCKPYNLDWDAAGMGISLEGYVQLHGLVVLSTSTVATNGATIGTLPEGFRPDRTRVVGVNNSDSSKVIYIRPDGTIKVGPGFAVGSYVSLDNAVYPAAGVATWTDVTTYASGFSAHASAEYAPAYWKDPLGLVWTVGLVRHPATAAPADNTRMLSLPASCAPAHELHVVSSAWDAFGLYGVKSDASVNYKTGSTWTSGGWTSLDSAPWAAADCVLPLVQPKQIGTSRYGTTFPAPGLRRTPGGLVVMQGLLLNPTGNSVPLWTAPTGFRTGHALRHAAQNQARGRLDIGTAPGGSSTGPTVLSQGAANAWFSLDGHAYIATS